MKTFLGLLLATALIVGLVAQPAQAARTTGSISAPILVDDVDGDTVISQGDVIRFDVVVNGLHDGDVAGATVRCYQDDVLVYGTGGYSSRNELSDRTYPLNSARWGENPGAADCHAEVYYFDLRKQRTSRTIAEVDFHVAA